MRMGEREVLPPLIVGIAVVAAAFLCTRAWWACKTNFLVTLALVSLPRKGLGMPSSGLRS